MEVPQSEVRVTVVDRAIDGVECSESDIGRVDVDLSVEFVSTPVHLPYERDVVIGPVRYRRPSDA